MVDDAFGYWLAGLVDGEGCFSMGRQRRDRPYIQCRFILSLRADDAPLLKMCAARTGVGRVLIRAARSGAKPFARWQVSGKAELAVIVGLFDAYPLRSKKARDFQVWRQAIVEWMNLEHNGSIPNDWSRMEKLRQKLADGRKYRDPAMA